MNSWKSGTVICLPCAICIFLLHFKCVFVMFSKASGAERRRDFTWPPSGGLPFEGAMAMPRLDCLTLRRASDNCCLQQDDMGCLVLCFMIFFMPSLASQSAWFHHMKFDQHFPNVLGEMMGLETNPDLFVCWILVDFASWIRVLLSYVLIFCWSNSNFC